MKPVIAAPLPSGAVLVSTPDYTFLHQMLDEVGRRVGALEVVGEGGTGKTFGCDSYFAARLVDVVKIHLENKVKGYEFLRRVIRELGGTAGGDGVALMNELEVLVGDRLIYVYIDEADLLNRDSLRQIRYLRDQAIRRVKPIRLVFILVGNDFGDAYRLVPQLYSRITRRVSFSPMSGAALLEALNAYHPALAATPDSLLERIDAEYCHGVWRLWQEVLPTCLDYAQRSGVIGITEEIAAAVLGVSIGLTRPPYAALGNSRPIKSQGNGGSRRGKAA